MAWIELPIAPELGREFPGILGPMTFRPETAKPINELVNVLLRGESTLSPGGREMIATHVSWRNDCYFCQTIHGAVAAAQLDHNEALVNKVKTDWLHADISPKLKALLNIAGKVQLGGRNVTADDVAAARAEGATDLEIHDTVLIAAVFCMCNRYVDGLNTWAPTDPNIYRSRAERIKEHGYVAVTQASIEQMNYTGARDETLQAK
ncbi:MAG TPA: peroxidase-related enzyme [Acidobacteriaceae bacterium]|nr:peroxidase-related enzyme [Acidobacteriaceae bacterium]